MKVIAFDADSKENGEIQYQKINTGNSGLLQDSIEIDINSGNLILVDNKGLDREVLDRFVLNIEAVDKGQPGPLKSQATVIINILDINDNPPIFKRRKYQGFMNQDLTDLRNDLQVEAVDLDQAGTKNSEIRYEIIHGNYEKKFYIDAITGKISIMEPLTPGLIRHGRNTQQEAVSVAKVQRISQANIEPVISLTVRAYDLGIPSLDSEVLVHIFTEQTSSRIMRFIVYQDPDDLDKNGVSDLISAMTGGQAEIQDIQPYSQVSSMDRMDYLEVDYIDTNRNDRNAKDYQDDQPSRSRRSLVDVRITYPTNTSIVDMNDITSKLVKEGSSSTVGPSTTPDPDMMKELEYKNAALFWGLITILAFIFIFIVLMTLCFCCPGCYFYKSKLGIKSASRRPDSVTSISSGIKVLKVRNGDGQELKDAKFVEVLKSANTGQSVTKRKVKQSGGFKNNKVKVYEPTYRDTNNIIFIRDELESGSSLDSNNSNAPIFVRALEQHSPGKLRQKQFIPKNPDEKIFKVVDETKRSSPARNADKDDIQIMKLDDDARITETYQKIGNAEVLAIEDNPIAEEITSNNIEYQDVATSPR